MTIDNYSNYVYSDVLACEIIILLSSSVLPEGHVDPLDCKRGQGAIILDILLAVFRQLDQRLNLRHRDRNSAFTNRIRVID